MIRNDEVTKRFARIDELWGSPINTVEGDELMKLVLEQEAWEEENVHLPKANWLDKLRYWLGSRLGIWI